MHARHNSINPKLYFHEWTSCVKKKTYLEWWYTPLVLALERKREVDLFVSVRSDNTCTYIHYIYSLYNRYYKWHQITLQENRLWDLFLKANDGFSHLENWKILESSDFSWRGDLFSSPLDGRRLGLLICSYPIILSFSSVISGVVVIFGGLLRT